MGAWTDLNTNIFKLIEFQWQVVKSNGELGGGLYSGDPFILNITWRVQAFSFWRYGGWETHIEGQFNGQRAAFVLMSVGDYGSQKNTLLTFAGKMPAGKDLTGKLTFRGRQAFSLIDFAEVPITIPNLDDIPPEEPDGIPPTVCTEGQERCVGYDREICLNNRWVIKEYNSPDCGYTPEPICTNGDDRCVGKDYQVCVGDHWETRERNSPLCGYVPPDEDWPVPPTDEEEEEEEEEGGIGGWFDRNKTAIIIGSVAVLVISIIVLATKRRIQFPVAAWPRFQPPIVRK